MLQQMRLHPEPFNKIKDGAKTIEMRLYDEKRQLLQLGDIIEFENRETGEKLRAQIVNFHRFASFAELYQKLDHHLLGYADEEAVDPTDMSKYYSAKDEQKYGVVGIEIKVVNSES